MAQKHVYEGRCKESVCYAEILRGSIAI
jgi:hypothetical protein